MVYLLEKGLTKLSKPSGPPPVWSSSQAGRKTLPLSKGTSKTSKTLKTPCFVGFAGSLEHALPLAKNSPPFKKHRQNRRNRQYPPSRWCSVKKYVPLRKRTAKTAETDETSVSAVVSVVSTVFTAPASAADRPASGCGRQERSAAPAAPCRDAAAETCGA